MNKQCTTFFLALAVCVSVHTPAVVASDSWSNWKWIGVGIGVVTVVTGFAVWRTKKARTNARQQRPSDEELGFESTSSGSLTGEGAREKAEKERIEEIYKKQQIFTS